MKYSIDPLLFSSDEEISIVGTPEQIKKILEYIQKEFSASRTRGWFENE